MLKVYDLKTNKEIHPNDTITDFRGDTHKFQCATRASSIGRSGKIVTTDDIEYYDKVFNLIVKEV